MWAHVRGEHARGAEVGEVEEEEQPAAQHGVEHEADRDGELDAPVVEGFAQLLVGAAEGGDELKGEGQREEEGEQRGREEHGDGGGVHRVAHALAHLVRIRL